MKSKVISNQPSNNFVKLIGRCFTQLVKRMTGKSKIILSILSLFLLSSSPMANESDLESNGKKKAAIILNHLHSSLNKIVTYNDKVILEEEYENIINNIDLTEIDDVEIVEQITYIMDVLTSHKISETEKSMLITEYQDKLDSAIQDSLSQTVSSIRGSNPIELTTNLVLGVGGVYMDYKNKQESYKKELDKSNWELDKGAISEINDLRKEFIQTYWAIMKRYGIPDEWRITESQFERFHSILKNDKGEVQYRKLLRMQKELSILPSYWFELSLSARKIGKKSEELEAIVQYESLGDEFFRTNPLYSLLLANKLSYFNVDSEQDKVASTIKNMLEVDPLNAERKLVAALKLIEINNYSDALDLLLENMDDGFMVRLSEQIRADIHLRKKDLNAYKSLVQTLLDNQNMTAADYLIYLGKKPLPLLIDEVEGQLEAIDVSLETNMYGKDDILVKLSKKWVFDDVDNTLVNLMVGKDKHRTTNLTKENDTLILEYGEVFERDTFVIGTVSEVSLDMRVKNVPVEIVFSVTRELPEEKQNETESVKGSASTKTKKEDEGVWDNLTSLTKNAIEKTKDYSDKNISELKNYIGEKFLFSPIKIFAGGRCFDVSNKLSECK